MTGKCMIIMPFRVREPDRAKYSENHWSEVYAGLLRPAVEAAGLECHRDDDDFSSRPLALNIWKKLEDSDLVLCDVSSGNPNVFVELGWAFRADKPYVIAMDEVSQAPFDVGDFNRFHYNHDLRPLSLKEQIPRLTRMLRETLADPANRWSILRNLGVPSPAGATIARPRCSVDIYWYDKVFTQQEAGRLAGQLRQLHISTRMMEHAEPNGPDAIFVGSLVEAADARLVLENVPYPVRFMFRPDYPESEGGDSSGYKIGIGYSSKYHQGGRDPRAEPFPVTRSDLARLLDPGHNNASFQRTIWELALRKSGISFGDATKSTPLSEGLE